MGVYIKGMEMPDSCDVCKFSDWSNLHQTACCKILEYRPCFRDYSSEYKTRISDLCPLVEVPTPHGDLIDRDILEQELINGIKAGNFEEGYEHYANINNMDDCVECVRYADTVIEAEDGT